MKVDPLEEGESIGSARVTADEIDRERGLDSLSGLFAASRNSRSDLSGLKRSHSARLQKSHSHWESGSEFAGEGQMPRIETKPKTGREDNDPLRNSSKSHQRAAGKKQPVCTSSHHHRLLKVSIHPVNPPQFAFR
jgi:hypothetical protein